MLHGHGNYLVRFVAIGDELNGLSFRLGVLDELFEPSYLDEEFDCIFQVDAIVGNVPMALVELTLFCFVDPFPLLQWSLWWLDASFCQIGYSDLGEDFLPRHGQGCILSEAIVGSFAFTSYFAFLLFLMEGIFGGFSSKLLLPGFDEVVRVQLFFISAVDLCDH